MRRTLYYMTHPRMLAQRIKNLRIGGIPLKRAAQGIRVYVTHPSLIPGRLRRTLGASPPPASSTSPTVSLAEAIKNPQFFANHLFATASGMYGADLLNLPQASGLMEAAWVLTRDPLVAIHLAGMMIKMNCNDRAMRIYRTALRLTPDDLQLHFHAGIDLLRHGTRAEVESFYDDILERTPNDPLALFVQRSYREFPNRVRSLVDALATKPSGEITRPKLLIVAAVWGKAFVEKYARYLLASLLAEKNIPAMSNKYDIVCVLFTTEADIHALKDTPQYKIAAEYCRFHFEFYTPSDVVMARHPDGDIANTVKFSLMSRAHYATIEASRLLNATTLVFGADNVVNDGFLNTMDRIFDADHSVAAISIPGYRLYADQVIPMLNAQHRRKNGAISIVNAEFEQLIMRFMPPEFFIDSPEFARFPLFLCWRVGRNGMIVHANHHMPSVIRGGALKGPVDLSIDPVDGRFLLRHLADLKAIHMIDSAEMGLFDLADNPLIDTSPGRPFKVDDVTSWLWCYIDDLRRLYFHHGVRYGTDRHSQAFDETERHAKEIVDDILARIDRLEADKPSAT